MAKLGNWPKNAKWHYGTMAQLIKRQNGQSQILLMAKWLKSQVAKWANDQMAYTAKWPEWPNGHIPQIMNFRKNQIT